MKSNNKKWWEIFRIFPRKSKSKAISELSGSNLHRRFIVPVSNLDPIEAQNQINEMKRDLINEENFDPITDCTCYYNYPVESKSRKWWQFWKKIEPKPHGIIENYNEKYNWDENSGTLNIDGNTHLPYKKEIWFPSPDYNQGSPNIENLNNDQWIPNNNNNNNLGNDK